MELKDIYTNLEDAKTEIKRRWKDKDLEKKISDYLDGDLPEPFKKEPRAVSTIHVATPNWATIQFLIDSLDLGLKPLIFEYLDDIFVTTNFDKALLGKLTFYHGRNDNGGMITTSKHLIDLSGVCEKRKFSELKTLSGESFVDFHHKALSKFYGDKFETYDGSDFYHKTGKTPKEYYLKVFALYIRNGVLFENYLLTKKEGVFVEEVLLPAFEKVHKHFGLKPLIVPISPLNEQDKKYWWYYPEFIKTLL